MKEIKYLTISGILIVFVLALSCQKAKQTEIDLTENVVGTYKGTLTQPGLKIALEATTDVTKTNFNIVQIHCYSTVLDTTFVMELFENGDSLMVCNIGTDFITQYGHTRMNEHHMMGSTNWQDWMHHLNEEHRQDDEQFGGFNIMDHNFGYRFIMSDPHKNYILQFNGTKQ